MPSQTSGQNQTLLELIYALKSLAQTVEFYHQDLTRQLDEASKDRQRELDRIRDIVAKNAQAMAVLPITLSDRVEKLVGKMEDNVDDKLELLLKEVNSSINEVRNKLTEYVRIKESNSDDAIVESELSERDDVTGKVEVTKDGTVNIALKSSLAKKLLYLLIAVASSGGLYGASQALKSIFGG